MLLGYCSLQVEVAGIGRMNTNQRMLFPLVRTDRAEALIRRATARTAVAEPASVWRSRRVCTAVISLCRSNTPWASPC